MNREFYMHCAQSLLDNMPSSKNEKIRHLASRLEDFYRQGRHDAKLEIRNVLGCATDNMRIEG